MPVSLPKGSFTRVHKLEGQEKGVDNIIVTIFYPLIFKVTYFHFCIILLSM
jgi:hypothetical protein